MTLKFSSVVPTFDRSERLKGLFAHTSSNRTETMKLSEPSEDQGGEIAVEMVSLGPMASSISVYGCIFTATNGHSGCISRVRQS